jgi:hypothetical protein
MRCSCCWIHLFATHWCKTTIKKNGHDHSPRAQIEFHWGLSHELNQVFFSPEFYQWTAFIKESTILYQSLPFHHQSPKKSMCLFSSKFVSGSQRHLRKFCVSGHKEESDNAESKQGKTQNFPSPSLSAISTVCIYKNKSERRVRAPKARGIIRGYCGAAHSYGPTQNLHHNNKKQRRLKTFLALPLFCLANTWTASLMERRPNEKSPRFIQRRAEVSASASVAGDGCRRRRLLPSLYSPSYRFDCWAQPLMSPSPAASMSQTQMLHKPSLI